MRTSLVIMALIPLGVVTIYAQPGQIDLSRVEMMPSQPAPYNMRDWREVAERFDDFVFDDQKTGTYLPFVSFLESGISYPERPSFGLHTYVGTGSPDAGEAINVLPALVGATLVGIDKTDQFGRNWILMSQDYFARNRADQIYVNNRGGGSGNDWWYDMMPNVYFFQLYDLYGPVGNADDHFKSVSNQMLRAVREMGGSDTPWQRASMNYRAWDFASMQPNTMGVVEPEAAGAYAWLLYHAYKKTGDIEYLKGAEWSMEFLNFLGSNPSYELQLPYGAYIAARMNAELQTRYFMEKILSWVFDRGPIRGWGTIVGTWGGLDVSGLVGEANDSGNDYAFQMNGVQQAAALVPLVRYDKRFARAIAKWFLNMANATRLMYPGFLPANLQDASDWSGEYDPEAVIGYEALREQWEGNSPFSTGDALRGGWAATNLALYGSSSIGYLGALFEKTNQEQILQIDALVTDFFGDEAFPTYLLYNPYSSSRSVDLDVGEDPVDIYESLTETFLVEGVSGEQSVEIPANEAVLIVLAPSGGQRTYRDNKFLIDGVVVDYMQSQVDWNAHPRIQALAATDTTVERSDTLTIYGTATDRETKNPTFEWTAESGTISGSGETIDWIAPQEQGTVQITLEVTDGAGQKDTAYLNISVVEEVNIPPVIDSLVTDGEYALPGGSITLTCFARDANADSLAYEWSASAGVISGDGPVVTWQGPPEGGIATIRVTVSDSRGGTDESDKHALFYAFDNTGAQIVAHYPFDGDALDISGNAFHGQVRGPKLTADRNGVSGSAYFFDGVNDHITVANSAGLNFQQGITISCWIKPRSLPASESFIISHGSWQNRWKLSVIPDRSVRWTAKTTSGAIRDLDSGTSLEEDTWYHVAATYDGAIFLVYINGLLESYAYLTGDINTTDIDMEIGQILPDDQAYNFGGDIDDIRIYDQALHPDSIAALAGRSTTSIKSETQLSFGVSPNPATGALSLDLGTQTSLQGILQINLFASDGSLAASYERSALRTINIDLTNLEPGLYFVEVSGSGWRGIEKIIIAK